MVVDNWWWIVGGGSLVVDSWWWIIGSGYWVVDSQLDSGCGGGYGSSNPCQANASRPGGLIERVLPMPPTSYGTY